MALKKGNNIGTKVVAPKLGNRRIATPVTLTQCDNIYDTSEENDPSATSVQR